jgi:hypothetical protein
LDERFPGEWHAHALIPDLWIVRNSRGAKLVACDPAGKPLHAEAVSLNIRLLQTTRDSLKAIALEQNLMNPKHPDSPNISAAIEWLVAQYRAAK